ncbi:MAG TPA: amidase [Phototrophicaceae bacterium]|nr:amidase [Phototrophicaceae bacterium]
MSEEQQETTPSISAADVAAAEKLIGLNFTDAERDQLLDAVNNRAKQYEKLRAIKLENSVAPPLHFDPRPLRARSSAAERTYRMSAQGEVERPENLEDVAFWPLTKLAELIRTRQVTSLELTEMYLARLKRFDPFLHCVVTYTEDLAYQQAKRADEEIASGKYRSPLHGIPWGAKDLFAVRGYRTTWGAEPYRDQMIGVNATIVERLEAAGAVLIAKLTLGALAYGDIWFDATTRNPWNLDEGSSGSSAGSGSAVAAGLVGFAIGTETLGSIVSPSTRCGVSGLRPTFGRISRYGAMALAWSMDKAGPMCRSVEDCALVFTAVYGSDGLDAAVVDAPFEWNPDLDLRKLRVGYVEKAFEKAPEATEDTAGIAGLRETGGSDADRAVLDVLRAQGIDLIPMTLPDDDLEPVVMILFAEAAAAFDDLTLSNQDDQLTWQDKEAWPNSFRAARFMTAVEYIRANRARALLIEKMAALMDTVDVFVVPPFAANALTLTNLTGHPAVVVPNGFNEQGSPTSVTFIGRLYHEAEVLAVARLYQDATDFHLKHPPMNYAGESSPARIPAEAS